MKGGGSEQAKRNAGESAAAVVEDGMTVGLGTGSTAAHAIRHLGERVDAGLDISGIPTSYQSQQLAREVGIPLVTLEDATPDVAIDGADQVANGNLVKGGGGAHLREKVIASAASRFHVVVDESKRASELTAPVPVEVLPDARPTVTKEIENVGGQPTLRSATRKDGPVITDNGNFVLDCEFGEISDPEAVARNLEAIPGVLAHGLFIGLADEIHVGTSDSVTVLDAP